METNEVKIDFDALSESMRRYIRETAIEAGTTIVYLENHVLTEENPVTGEKKSIKAHPETVKL